MLKKLTVLASMSGGGKTTYANTNFEPEYHMPDTNVGVYKLYHDLFRGPALEQNLEPDKLTGLTLWSVKKYADLEFLKGWDRTIERDWVQTEYHFVNMRSGWDFLIYDEKWQNRKIMDEDVMFSHINDIESQFDEVEYKIWHMKDEKIIEELMSRNDDRSNLFNNDPKIYHEWQDHFVKRYLEIMDKFGYNYTLEEVKYN